MALQTLFTNSTTSINLLSSDELFVGQNANLAVNGTAIVDSVGAGSHTITIAGNVSSNSAFVSSALHVTNGISVGTAITQSGSLTGFNGPVVNIASSIRTTVQNAGVISSFGNSDPAMLFIATDSGTSLNVLNSGSISAMETAIDVIIGSGYAQITNSGTISTHWNSIEMDFASTGYLRLFNTGTITAITGNAVYINTSSSVRNEGTLSYTYLGAGTDTVTNLGSIIGGVGLADGNDTYRGVGNGVVAGTVSGGTGNDALFGANLSDTLNGGADTDTLRGFGGDDSWLATLAMTACWAMTAMTPWMAEPATTQCAAGAATMTWKAIPTMI